MSGMRTFARLDYWKLADELSVIDAAFLTLNWDPGDFELHDYAFPETSKIFKVGGHTIEESRRLHNSDEEKLEVHSAEFRAVFKALRNAIMGDKLKAKIVRLARPPSYGTRGALECGEGKRADETLVTYGCTL